MNQAVAVSYILGALVAVLGVAGLVAAAYAVIRTNTSQSTIQTLEHNNAALSERVKILEDSDAECKRRLEHVQMQNKVLTDLVTSAPAIAEVKATVDMMSRDMQHGFDLLAQVVAKVGEAVTAVLHKEAS